MASSAPIIVNDKPPRSRRRIPLSLRMFVALVLVTGIGSASWIGIPAYRQHVAIQEVQRLGGYVVTLPRGPKLLRDWTGDEWMMMLDVVDVVYLDGRQATDSTLAHLGRLYGLRVLELGKTEVSDAGLVHLIGLNTLERLILSHTRVTDSGMAHVGKMTGLKEIGLDHTHVTDAGLAHLKRLPNLEYVWVENTFVSYAGIVDFYRSMPGLTTISR
jgi:hypothetical protein